MPLRIISIFVVKMVHNVFYNIISNLVDVTGYDWPVNIHGLDCVNLHY